VVGQTRAVSDGNVEVHVSVALVETQGNAPVPPSTPAVRPEIS